jgi:hypothetical protein
LPALDLLFGGTRRVVTRTMVKRLRPKLPTAPVLPGMALFSIVSELIGWSGSSFQA